MQARFVLVVALAGGCSSGHPDRGPAAPADAPTHSESTATPTPPTDFDAALAAHWVQAGVEPTATVDDLGFLRRATVDLWGRIPRPQEVQAFVDDDRPDKRARWVDAALDDPQWSDHWADVLTEALLGGSKPMAGPDFHPAMHAWLRDALDEGRGWDEITTAVLTATGDPADGPAAFVATHGRKGRVEALTGQTGRVFLGLSVQCAQCHDHPDDDRYRQRDFYGLAAAFARTRARRGGGKGSFVVVDARRGRMRMPRPEDPPGERTGPIVEASFPGLSLAERADESPRDALARSIVASALLDTAIVNRVWAKMMSHGWVDPIDDLGAADDPRQPAPLRALASELRAHDHDLRWLVRRIVLSPAYQRDSAGPPHGPDAGADARRAAFAQFPVRPLDDDELLASLLVATGADTSSDRRVRRRMDRGQPRLRRQFAFVFDDDEMGTGAPGDGSVSQALLLLNGALTSEGSRAARDSMLARILADHDDPAARIDALYLATVARPATPQRREALVRFVRERGDASSAYEDLAHALLASAEFATNH